MANWNLNGHSLLLALETCLMGAVILFIPYTEIDWRAYMEEVEGVLGGELDYAKLKGGTGPLVYPGGFVWLYSALYFITRRGYDIFLAQFIYLTLYIGICAIVLHLYRRANIGWRGVLPLFLSKRIRSIFVLRLFNDCWAMFFLFGAVLLLAEHRRWKLGCLVFSIAVSIKMNVLLFSPGLFYVLVRSVPPTTVLSCLSICAWWQLVVGGPFLLHSPASYLGKSFELGRIFLHEWTVNYKWLPEEVFVRPELGCGLLVATIVCWLLAWRLRWSKRNFTVAQVVAHRLGRGGYETAMPPEAAVTVSIALTLFESNLIGVALSRSLHYQFLSWFFHSIPFVLAFTKLPRLVRLAIFGVIRHGFQTYPPSVTSSALVLSALLAIAVAIVFLGNDDPQEKPCSVTAPPPSATDTATEQAKALEKKNA